jgi:RNA polymerase sigma-70 factor (ECF subfamily)
MTQKDQNDITHIQNILGINRGTSGTSGTCGTSGSSGIKRSIERKKSEQHIYSKYSKIIKKIIIAKYGKSFDIDDHVSDIMVKIFLNLDKFDETKSNFNTWIFNIVKNHMNTVARDIKTKKFYETEYYSNSTIDFCDVSTLYETNNTLDYISRKISISEFEMLSLKYFDGYNYDEIGKELNTSSTVACNKINYIKSKLKNDKHLIYD